MGPLYSLKAYVACGNDINDLSCLADPTVPEGISLAQGCPATTMPPVDPFIPFPFPNECQYIGTHDGGSEPNWWQSGNAFEYQAFINIPLNSGSRSPVIVPCCYTSAMNGSIKGGWYIDLKFQNPIESMHFWSGQAQKRDNAGYQWRLIGWCIQTWNGSIDLTYIARTNASGINPLARFLNDLTQL